MNTRPYGPKRSAPPTKSGGRRVSPSEQGRFCEMKIQTDGFLAVGDLPNDEHVPCLVCRCVPDRVWQDIFCPEPGDIPSSFVAHGSKTLVMTYRLCPGHAKVAPWRIRLLMLERLNVMASGQ
jgi:hypothetical protein